MRLSFELESMLGVTFELTDYSSSEEEAAKKISIEGYNQ
jgi:hypothetical protein